MVIAHLTASTFFGGPERQMLGLGRSLAPDYRSVYLSFAEGNRCRPFLHEARRSGFEAWALAHDTPYFRAAIKELSERLQQVRARVLCCHGYKAGLLGRLAARRQRIPVIAVSRGWTGESRKIRFYETLDRLNLRWMDRVVCVSEGQAAKVRRAGVPSQQIRVVHNAIETERFRDRDPSFRFALQSYFAKPRSRIIAAAGRLSPEKGFDILIEAARQLVRKESSLGFILFGDGVLREKLSRQVADAGLRGTFVLAGFRNDLDQLLPFCDLLALPSYTEGLPNVVLEAFAAGVPVVATAVGGTPEVVEDGNSGYLVPSGDPASLAARMLDTLASEQKRRKMGQRGRDRVVKDFTFAAQSRKYQKVFEDLTSSKNHLEQENAPGLVLSN
jgi:glycosyltransferase involved in cell wall biosynthesis